MILRNPTYRKLLRLRKARNQPCLPQTSFNVQLEMEAARLEYFPAFTSTPPCYFVIYGSLACICIDSETAFSNVYLHQILNHPETPREVITLICKHELLHLEIPPREISGKKTNHPPEFWEREKVICPEKEIAWAWIWENLYRCISVDLKQEGIIVTKDWKKRWNLPRIGIDDVRFADYFDKGNVL